MDHIFATAAVERRGGGTDTGWPLSLLLSLSHTHTPHAHASSPASHLIGGGLEQAGATIAADGELERSSLFFPLKLAFATLLSSPPTRWCSACEKSVGFFQMARCKCVTRSRIGRAASSARWFLSFYLDSADHQTRTSAADRILGMEGGRVKAVCGSAVLMAASALDAAAAAADSRCVRVIVAAGRCAHAGLTGLFDVWQRC